MCIHIYAHAYRDTVCLHMHVYVVMFAYMCMSCILAGRCMALDRDFAYFGYVYIFCDLLLSFECLWTSFCFSWDDSGFPLAPLGWWSVLLGRPGLPIGFRWGHFGILLAPLGCRWDHLGTLGSQVGLGVTLNQNWTSVSVIIWSVCDACA